MKASRFSPLSRGSFVQVRSEIVGWSSRYCAFAASGRDFNSGSFFVFFGFGVAAVRPPSRMRRMKASRFSP